MTNQHRIPELDALRGVAATLVILFHFSLLHTNPLLPFNFFKYGNSGVDLFFMISGFVIFMSIKTGEKIKNFWFARFKRLMPAYWFCLFVQLLICWLSVDCIINRNWNYLAGNLLMMWPIFKTHELVGAYWTLYIELTFYVLMSVIMLFKLTYKIEWVIWFGLAAMLLINGSYVAFPSNAAYTRFFIITREVAPMICYFSFFASGIVYYQIYQHRLNANRVALLITSFLITALIHNISGVMNLHLSVTERLACGAVFNVMFCLIVSCKAQLLKFKLLYFLGIISYPLYLIHESVGYKTFRLLLNKTTLTTAVLCGIVVSVLSAIAITYLIERPARRWLKSVSKAS